MRNSASRRSRIAALAVAAWLSVCAVAGAQTAKARFDEAIERDVEVRALLSNVTDKSAAVELLKQISRVMTSFELIVRRFPTSSYADNALWQAATLGEAAHQRLNRDDDRERALKFYRWLVQEYPASTYVRQANVKIAGLTTGTTLAVPTVVAAATPVAATVAPAVIQPAAERATLTTIQRVVLPNAVRITLELDREVAYREERLAGPSRLFFDLKNVQLTPALMDKVLSYGSDIVNKIRVGRHPDHTVRVVLDFQDVSRYSVFTLYSPFRLVIDAERSVTRTVAIPTVVAPVSTENAPLVSAAATDVPRLVAATRSEPAAPPARTGETGAVLVIPAPRRHRRRRR